MKKSEWGGTAIPVHAPVPDGVDEPIGKFSMADSWLPPETSDSAPHRGYLLPEPDYLLTELAEFTAYWESEGKVLLKSSGNKICPTCSPGENAGKTRNRR